MSHKQEYKLSHRAKTWEMTSSSVPLSGLHQTSTIKPPRWIPPLHLRPWRSSPTSSDSIPVVKRFSSEISRKEIHFWLGDALMSKPPSDQGNRYHCMKAIVSTQRIYASLMMLVEKAFEPVHKGIYYAPDSVVEKESEP